MFNRLAHLVKLCKSISSNYGFSVLVCIFLDGICVFIFFAYISDYIIWVIYHQTVTNGYHCFVCRIGFCRNNYLVIQFFIVNKWFGKVFVTFGITRINFMLFLGYFFSFSYCTCTQWSCWFYRVRFWWNQICGFWNVRFVCKGCFYKRNCFCQ